jgi:hypothetical protein
MAKRNYCMKWERKGGGNKQQGEVGISLAFWVWTKQVKSGSNMILQGSAGVNFCF